MTETDEKASYGYIDKDGSYKIGLPEYDFAKKFTEGLAAVEKGSKWGYINHEGKQLIQFKYDNADYFSEGLAAVLVGDKWGYIDTEGKSVIEPQFDFAGLFSSGKAIVVQNNETSFVGRDGKEIDAIENRSQPQAPADSFLLFSFPEESADQFSHIESLTIVNMTDKTLWTSLTPGGKIYKSHWNNREIGPLSSLCAVTFEKIKNCIGNLDVFIFEQKGKPLLPVISMEHFVGSSIVKDKHGRDIKKLTANFRAVSLMTKPYLIDRNITQLNPDFRIRGRAEPWQRMTTSPQIFENDKYFVQALVDRNNADVNKLTGNDDRCSTTLFIMDKKFVPNYKMYFDYIWR